MATFSVSAYFPQITLPFYLSIDRLGFRTDAREAASSLGCDNSFVVLPLLAGLASAVGNTRRVRLKTDWPEPAIIWAVIVGESGSLKSPALKQALAPVAKRERETARNYEHELKVYEFDAPKKVV